MHSSAGNAQGTRPVSPATSVEVPPGPPVHATGASARPRTLAYLAVLTYVFTTGATFIAAKQALAELSPIALATLRFLVGSSLFAAILVGTGRRLLPPARHLGRAAVLGALAVPLTQWLYLTGLLTTTAVHGALLYSLVPLFIYLFATALGHERWTLSTALGLAIAFGGAIIVISGRASGGFAWTSLLGDLLVLCSAASWALYSVLCTPLIREGGTIQATAWAFIVGTVLLLPLGVSELVKVDVFALSSTTWACILFLGLVHTVLGYLCWSYGVSRLPPSRAAVLCNFQPVVTAVIASAALGQPLHVSIIIGGACVIGGLIVTQVAKRHPLTPNPSNPASTSTQS